MTNSIEASANALKLSYLRFVSDSAPGLLLVLVLVVLADHGMLDVRIIPEDRTEKTIGAILVVLLATPIGLVINGASHFLLGGIQHAVDRMCFLAKGWPLADTKSLVRFEQWRAFFDIRSDDWPCVANEVDEILDALAPHLTGMLDHVRALKKLCRSIAFLAVLASFVTAGMAGAAAAAGVISGTAIMVLAPWDSVRRAAGCLVCASIVSVIPICYVESVIVTAALWSSFAAFIFLAGLVDFYQHGLTMLFTYQLVERPREEFRITPSAVRDRLTKFAKSSRA